jgi:hypothetical protein
MVLATFWASFSKAHLVTLVVLKTKQVNDKTTIQVAICCSETTPKKMDLFFFVGMLQKIFCLGVLFNRFDVHMYICLYNFSVSHR